MIDNFNQQQQQNEPQQIPDKPAQPQPQLISSPSVKKQQQLPELLKTYIKQSVSIHRERLQRTEQSNQILSKEYRIVDIQLDKVKENKSKFNKQLDAMIGILKQVDRVQVGIIECQKNAKQIFDMIGLIEKKMAVKLQKKIQGLEKLKKQKGSK